MAKVFACVATVYLAIFLFGYKPSIAEASIVFGFGLFAFIAGGFAGGKAHE
jgi:hypothetical protein